MGWGAKGVDYGSGTGTTNGKRVVPIAASGFDPDAGRSNKPSPGPSGSGGRDAGKGRAYPHSPSYLGSTSELAYGFGDSASARAYDSRIAMIMASGMGDVFGEEGEDRGLLMQPFPLFVTSSTIFRL